MNRMTRLTALLLALLMIFSNFAVAESYPVGSMTQEQWAEIVKQAEEELYSVKEGGNNVIERPLPEPLESKPYQNTYDDVKLSDGAAEMTTADLAIVKSDVAGQWQIAIGEDVIQWVNLAGETGATLNVTAALLAGSATKTIRQVVDGEVIGTMVFTVTEPVAVMSLEVAAREGTTTPADSDNVMTLEEANTSTTATFTIEYKYDDGDTAADPHSETQPINFTMTLSKPNPPIVGYKVGKVTINGTTYEELPAETTDGISVTENQVSLSSYKLAADLDIVVTYVPALVDYTIKYYFEPVAGGKHVEDASIKPSVTVENGALTGSIVDIDPDKTLPGFTLLYYDRPEIAADGSTVVNVYYNREWYLMSFDMDGGYGVEPIYAKYGAPITVGTPLRPGYTFLGWSLTPVVEQTKPTDEVIYNKVDVPTTMPSENTTYYAVWDMNDTAKVSIVIWGENADDDGYSYNQTIEATATTGTQYIYGGANLTCTQETHKHVDECLQCTQVEHNHSIKNNCYTLTCTDTGHSHENCEIDCKHTHSLGCILVCSHTHTDECYTCGITAYTHKHSLEGGCYQLSCSITPHTHDTTCYDCGKLAHAHDEDCFTNAPAFPVASDTYLWKFAGMDVVEVKADGSTVVNVYYDRTTFTLTFKQDNTTIKTIADKKWGADIHSEFPITNDYGTIQWTVPDGCVSMEPDKEFASLDTMPAENITFQYYTSSNAVTLYYYVETLPNVTGEKSYGDKQFDEYKAIDIQSGVYLTYTEEFHDIKGFTQWESEPAFNKHEQGGRTEIVYDDCELYYTRNTFSIVYYDPTTLVKTISNVPYQASLNSTTYNWEPTPPSTVEPGSVVFAGWYLNPEGTGEPFDFTTATMPAGPNNTNGEVALSLYAKWVPVKHDVTFYISDEAAAKHGTTAAEPPLKGTYKITHRELVPEADIPVTNPEVEGCIKHPTDPDNYEFDGWFYMDGDVEKPYTKEMPVIRDLVIYAKWKTTQVQTFTVRYVYVDEKGNELAVIADEKTGEGLVDTTVTFDAKTGTGLNPGYQEGYFPLVPSHSITISEIAADNVYTFKYVHKDSVPYTVYYIVVDVNGNPIGEAYEPITDYDNTKAAVTEKFLPKAGYISWDKQYQKTLTVAANGQPTDVNNNNVADYVDNPETTAVEYENVIFFYYYADPNQSPYFIRHMLQNADGSGHTEYEPDTIIGTGMHGHTYGDDTNAYPNYEFDYAEVKYLDGSNKTERLNKVDTTPNVSYQLPQGGMEILIYYKLSVSTLTITKTVVGDAPTTDTFDITVTFTTSGTALPDKLAYTKKDGTSGEVELTAGTEENTQVAVLNGVKNGDEITIEGITIGTGYTIEETRKEVYYLATYDENQSGEIVANGVTAGVTNTYQTGSLTISKQVVGETAPDDDEFTFTVELSAGTYGYTKGTTTGTYDFKDGAKSIVLKHNESVTISGIPANTAYTVTESVDSAYEVNPANGVATGTIPGNNTATAEFVNTYKYGDLVIEKQVENADSQSFIFEVKGPNNFSCVVTIQGAGSVTLADLEPGVYTVKEKTDWSYRFTKTSPEEAETSKTIEKGKTETVTFTNDEKTDKWLHDEGSVTNTFATN